MGLTTTNVLVRRIIMVIISKSAEVSSEDNEYHGTIIDKRLTFDSQVESSSALLCECFIETVLTFKQKQTAEFSQGVQHDALNDLSSLYATRTDRQAGDAGRSIHHL